VENLKGYAPIDSGLTRKHQTRMENLARDRQSSLCGFFISDEEKNVVL
jgi:hypothetical protein